MTSTIAISKHELEKLQEDSRMCGYSLTVIFGGGNIYLRNCEDNKSAKDALMLMRSIPKRLWVIDVSIVCPSCRERIAGKISGDGWEITK